MKKLIHLNTLVSIGIASLLLLQPGKVPAQDRPDNFDPEQMRQRMLERMRDQFEVKDDAEWKLISERITKVMEARRAVGGPGGFRGFGPPGGPGGPPPADADDAPDRARGGPGEAGASGFRGGPGGFNRESNVQAESLRKAIESKASAAELKAKMAEVRTVRQKAEADLQKAQEDLRQILSLRQEATALSLGLVK